MCMCVCVCVCMCVRVRVCVCMCVCMHAKKIVANIIIEVVFQDSFLTKQGGLWLGMTGGLSRQVKKPIGAFKSGLIRQVHGL